MYNYTTNYTITESDLIPGKELLTFANGIETSVSRSINYYISKGRLMYANNAADVPFDNVGDGFVLNFGENSFNILQVAFSKYGKIYTRWGTGSEWSEWQQVGGDTDLETKVTELETFKNSVPATYETIANVATVRSDVTDLQGRMSTAEGSIDTLEDKVAELEPKTNLVSSDTIAVENETSQTKLNLAAGVLADINKSLKLPISAPSTTQLVGVSTGKLQIGLAVGTGLKVKDSALHTGIKKIYTSGVVDYDGDNTDIGSLSKTLVDTTNNIYIATVALNSDSVGGQLGYVYNYNVILQSNDFTGTAGGLVGTLFTWMGEYDDPETGNLAGWTRYSVYIQLSPSTYRYNVRVGTNEPDRILGGFTQVEVTIYEVPLLPL